MSFSYIRKRNEKSKLTYEIRFLDSFAFMLSSLDSLSKNLPEDKFIISKNYYNREATISGGNQNYEIFKLMKRKGVYPYEYIDSFKKYDEPKLPGIKMFDDALNGVKCQIENYNHGKKVFIITKCRNLRDYTLKYMTNDVLLLADVFETFRETCMKN